MPKLIEFTANWADEMDIREVGIWSDEEERENRELVESAHYPVSLYVGTNQDITFYSAIDVRWKSTEISQSTYDELKKAKPYGWLENLDRLLESLYYSMQEE